MTTAEARVGDKRWVVDGWGIDKLVLVDEVGTTVYESMLPWVVGRLDDGTKVDVVGVLLKKAVVVDDLDEATFESLRPVLVRGTDDENPDDRPGMRDAVTMYLPLATGQLSHAGTTGDRDEFFLEVPMIVEEARQQERRRVERVTISRTARR